MSATAADEQPIMETVYVADTVHWYPSTPCRISSWAEMEVTGSATQTIRVHLAACQQTEQDTVVAQLIKSYSYCRVRIDS